LRRRIARHHPSLIRIATADEASTPLMVAFYSEWSVRGLGVRTSWKDHVRAFLDSQRPNVTVIRYEDVRRDPFTAMTTALASIAGTVPRAEDVAFAVARNEFSRQTGRSAGIADNRSTKRQGLVDAWQKELPHELAVRMSNDFAAELEMAGYLR
jgi:hypothetical protein